MRVVCCGAIAQRCHQLQAGIGVKLFGRGHLGQRGLNLGPVAGTLGPRFGQLHEIPPLIAPCAGPGKELIDLNPMTVGSAGHMKILLA